ncbi:MAG: large conductance mechanosensitive channel protein MscL [Streptococcaceae bacterium]|jgi:large conductance mechanosensitive channel|nr:large conductance mechanosensitive channel protein MscL [Streptococcaceae bacterium]MCH4176783.1 large conductance mechanosensitive channel protein MscL [Streptococcaceae bacterium]
MIKEFKAFIMQGSVVDLAVGVVIGGAFTAVVKSVVESVITPLITLIIFLATGSKSTTFSGLTVDYNGIQFKFGDLISAIITFLITGIVLFLIVKAFNKAKSFGHKPEVVEEAPVTEVDLLQDIKLLLEKNK